MPWAILTCSIAVFGYKGVLGDKYESITLSLVHSRPKQAFDWFLCGFGANNSKHVQEATGTLHPFSDPSTFDKNHSCPLCK